MSSEITTKGYEIDRNVHFTYKAEPDKRTLPRGYFGSDRWTVTSSKRGSSVFLKRAI